MLLLTLLSFTGVVKAQETMNYLGGSLVSLDPGKYVVYYEDGNGTKHYLWNNRETCRVNSTTDPKFYDITVGNVTDGYAPYAYFFDMGQSKISNPENNDAMQIQVELAGKAYPNNNYENNRLWESQVIFKNDDGKYAIRTTNCKAGAGWKSDAYITISEDGQTVNGIQNAANAEDVYKWTIEEVEATIGEMGYTTLNSALNAAKDGETVTLLKDVTTEAAIVINKAITLDGNEKKLTSTLATTAGRAINVREADEVTIQNLTIDAKGERAINVIQGAKKVNITNVTATAKNYAVNAATSAPNTVISISASELTGLNVVNIAAPGAQVTVDGTTLNCNDQSDAEGYAALCLGQEADGASISATDVTFNITCDEATPSHKAKCNVATGSITIGGSEDEVKKAVAVVEYLPGPYYYAFSSLQAAFDKAKEGETVKLVNDVVVDEAISVDKLVTLDFNEFNITRADGYGGYVFEVTGDLPMINGGLGHNIEKGATCYIINDNDYKTEEGKTFALKDNQMVDIEYNRTFGHTDYQVLYVPFAIPFNNIKDDFDVYSITNISDVVELTQITDGTLEANVPYMIKAKEAGDKTIKVSYEILLSNPKEYTQVLGDYTITGTYTSKAIEAGQQYVLTNGEWCQLSEAAVTNEQNILGAFRVYLTANGASNASVLRNVINGENATAIDELKATENGNGVIYDLSGRRIEKAVKGVFVVNGKKVVK